MKNTITLFLLLAFGLYANGQSNAETLKTFLTDIISFEDVTLDAKRPIAKIRQLASSQADTIFILTPENAAEAIKTAKNYQHCIIFTGSHTVTRVTNFDNSIQSGSWKARMPYGEGYIQRAELVKKTDYINNIIGVPDNQKRGFFLFKLK